MLCVSSPTPHPFLSLLPPAYSSSLALSAGFNHQYWIPTTSSKSQGPRYPCTLGTLRPYACSPHHPPGSQPQNSARPPTSDASSCQQPCPLILSLLHDWAQQFIFMLYSFIPSAPLTSTSSPGLPASLPPTSSSTGRSLPSESHETSAPVLVGESLHDGESLGGTLLPTQPQPVPLSPLLPHLWAYQPHFCSSRDQTFFPPQGLCSYCNANSALFLVSLGPLDSGRLALAQASSYKAAFPHIPHMGGI